MRHKKTKNKAKLTPPSLLIDALNYSPKQKTKEMKMEREKVKLKITMTNGKETKEVIGENFNYFLSKVDDKQDLKFWIYLKVGKRNVIIPIGIHKDERIKTYVVIDPVI